MRTSDGRLFEVKLGANLYAQMVRNLGAFYDAFGVTRDDALWLAPEDRVTIW